MTIEANSGAWGRRTPKSSPENAQISPQKRHGVRSALSQVHLQLLQNTTLGILSLLFELFHSDMFFDILVLRNRLRNMTYRACMQLALSAHYQYFVASLPA